MQLLLSKTCPARCTDMSQLLALSTDETEVIFNIALAGNRDKIKQARERTKSAISLQGVPIKRSVLQT